MKILADENIAQVREAFGSLGELVTCPGRAIVPDMLRDIDALLVRSVTRVDAALLDGSPCRFVGTATSGTDHIDQAYLRARGIAFASAPGANADSVVDYVFSSLAALARRDGFDWCALAVGIIGCGEVGGRLAGRLRALGIPCRIHDPFLDDTHPCAGSFAPLEDVLAQPCVSVHVPLTREGPHPTRDMLDAAALSRLRPDAIFINAARGGIVDEQALLELASTHRRLRLVMDVWDSEPAVSQSLLARADLATPHIAGYSRAGKVNGTVRVRAAFCERYALPMDEEYWRRRVQDLVPGPEAGAQDDVNTWILAAYDVRRDDARMRRLLHEPDPALHFDAQRRAYPVRAEFSECRVPARLPDALRRRLEALGFVSG